MKKFRKIALVSWIFALLFCFSAGFPAFAAEGDNIAEGEVGGFHWLTDKQKRVLELRGEGTLSLSEIPWAAHAEEIDHVSIFGDMRFDESAAKAVAAAGRKSITQFFSDGFLWTLNVKDDVLTLAGAGNFPETDFHPLDLILNRPVQKLVISHGITSIPLAVSYPCKTLQIGWDCQTVGGLIDSPAEKFQVHEKNRDFAVYDDSLYSKNLDKLIRIPNEKTSAKFPKSLKVIGGGSFSAGLTGTVVIPDTVEVIVEDAFFRTSCTIVRENGDPVFFENSIREEPEQPEARPDWMLPVMIGMAAVILLLSGVIIRLLLKK